MSNFVAGDKIRVTLSTGESVEAWLGYETEDFEGELVIFDGRDPFFPVTPLSALESDKDIVSIELVKAFADALPSEPGEYDCIVNDEDTSYTKFLTELGVDLPEPEVSRWTLSEDGTWTDEDGASKPASYNWLLVGHGYEFKRVNKLAS